MNPSTFLKKQIQELSPAYFALVMATGILSLDAHLQKLTSLSNLLFIFNNVAYGILALILITRLLLFFSDFSADLANFSKGAGFFTTVAGTSLLGIGYAQLKQAYTPAILLWYLGLIVWVILLYAFFTAIATKEQKPSLKKGINGLWLVVVVATQSVSILGTTLASHISAASEGILFFTLAAFLLGLMLYIILITLIIYRLTFFSLKPEEFKPTYWIAMGAVAITALSGATLTENLTNSTTFADLIPFLKGMSLFAWATATFWIPLLTVLEIWKYAVKKASLSYSPQFWSLVFCLGMYSVSTQKLSKALKATYIQPISQVFFYIALTVWAITFLGMIIKWVKSLSATYQQSHA